ncbi:MAG TPA: lactonase family protein [Bryobacteraceae bacterium]|nr:lactonase family protein [Bryobacteraceae bacterium]
MILRALLLLPATVAFAADNYLVYLGTYTNTSKSKGIYAVAFDGKAGKLGTPVLAAETPSPSFLAINARRRFLYAVAEGKPPQVSSFAIDAGTGKLTLLNTEPVPGSGPCYISLDRRGRHAFVANYGSGNVLVFPLGTDGRLKPPSANIQHSGSGGDPKRQSGPHAHSIRLSPDEKYAVAADLGIDQLLVYRFEPASGRLTPNEPPSVKLKPGSGPRHFAFHPNKRVMYSINELASTVSAFDWNGGRGTLEQFQTISTLPSGFSGNNTTAEIVVHPNGRFVYGSNRGHDSIAVFSADKRGTLRLVEHTPTQGNVPRNFAIDPAGKYLFAANQRTDNVVVFRIDPKTGRLAPAGTSVEVGSPVCVRFLKAD